MMAPLLDYAPLCGERFTIPRGGLDVPYIFECKRPKGHRPTGHEFVGQVYMDGDRLEHIHLIWGEQ